MKRLVLIALLLLSAPGALALETVPAREEHRWEIGLGILGGWKHLEEASEQDPFRAADTAGYGFALTGARWLNPRIKLSFDIEGTLQDTSIPTVQAAFTTFTFGVRGHFLDRGPIRPYLRASVGGANSKVESESGEESFKLSGMAAVMGAGLHMAPARRLRFELELAHAVIQYDDASVVLGDLYLGTRIDKAASATRLRFSTCYLF